MVEAAVVVGDRLGQHREYVAGDGTYIRQNHIYASVIGFKNIVADDGSALPKIEVRHDETPSLIQVGHIITGKVTRISVHSAFVEICAVGNETLKESHSGIIRWFVKFLMQSTEPALGQEGRCPFEGY